VPASLSELSSGEPALRSTDSWVALAEHCKRVSSKVTYALQSLDLTETTELGQSIVAEVDRAINAERPFSLAKEVFKLPHPESSTEFRFLAAILSGYAEALRIASVLLSPVMPEKMAELWRNWNCAPPPGATLEDLCTFGGQHALKPGQAIVKGEALFMRADPDEPKPGAGD